jgi:hypothetical protein
MNLDNTFAQDALRAAMCKVNKDGSPEDSRSMNKCDKSIKWGSLAGDETAGIQILCWAYVYQRATLRTMLRELSKLAAGNHSELICTLGRRSMSE